jgi:hypothetical protein
VNLLLVTEQRSTTVSYSRTHRHSIPLCPKYPQACGGIATGDRVVGFVLFVRPTLLESLSPFGTPHCRVRTAACPQATTRLRKAKNALDLATSPNRPSPEPRLDHTAGASRPSRGPRTNARGPTRTTSEREASTNRPLREPPRTHGEHEPTPTRAASKREASTNHPLRATHETRGGVRRATHEREASANRSPASHARALGDRLSLLPRPRRRCLPPLPHRDRAYSAPVSAARCTRLERASALRCTAFRGSERSMPARRLSRQTLRQDRRPAPAESVTSPSRISDQPQPDQ